MLLYKILHNIYWDYLSLSDIFSEYVVKRIENNKFIHLYTIAKCVDIEELGYTFEIFLDDYGEKVEM